MKKCELCPSAASMYCESDSASLCWDCDAKVHSANFLVERHSRSLLCNVCRSPTAWSASGPSLSRTLSVCHPCVLRSNNKSNKLREEEEERDCDTEDDYDGSEDDTEDDDDDSEEDEDEQVVPSPPTSSLSSGDESSSSEKGRVSKKRSREICSDDDFGCSSSLINAISFLARDSGASVRVDSSNRMKRLRNGSDKAKPVISGTCGMDHDTLAVGSGSDDSS